jgi:putative redox protein
MKDSINMSWKKGMAFEADVNGFKIMVDATSEHGGSNRGPRPKPLMMVALAGCTAMDVVSILQKMRVELDDLNVRIEGELTDEHPKHFTRMHIIYEFKGKDLPEEKLKKAIDLSQERYCGVSVSYRMAMDISYEIVIKQ